MGKITEPTLDESQDALFRVSSSDQADMVVG